MKSKTAKNAGKSLPKKNVNQEIALAKPVAESKNKAAAKPGANPLEECTKAHVSETYRLEDDDDACNDSVQ